MSKSTPPKVKPFPTAKQQRLDELLEKNSQVVLSAKERSTLESLVAEAEALMVANSQRLADFARGQSPQPPIASVPVTVWVIPQTADH